MMDWSPLQGVSRGPWDRLQAHCHLTLDLTAAHVLATGRVAGFCILVTSSKPGHHQNPITQI